MLDMINTLSTWIQQADTSLLLYINGLHTPLCDTIMRAISFRWIWIPLYLLLSVLAYRHGHLRGAIFCTLFLLLAIGISDQLCGSVLRTPIGRLRPSNLDNPISDMIHIVNNYRGGRYGFPSCHAANTATIAMFMSLYMRCRLFSWLIFGWAAIVSFSRIYLGVHYPCDVLSGFLIGSMVALGCYRLMLMSQQLTLLRHIRIPFSSQA